MNTFLRALDAFDIVVIGFYLFLSFALVLGGSAIPSPGLFLVLNACVIAAVFALARFFSVKSPRWRLWHSYLLMLTIPLGFKEIYFIGPALNPNDIDQYLIAADRWLFGTDPTHVLHAIAHPALTELLQIAYATFYFLPIILAADLFRKKRLKASRDVIYITVLGFFLSYFGYVAGPAIGPRFTLHDFERTDAELPGLFVTPALRAYTNAGESITPGMENPEAVVQRDCFPSGHTQMTLLVIILAFRFRAGSRWPLTITGSLLIFATVYLRYHYVVDLIAGALWALATLWIAPRLEQWWRARISTPGRD